MWDCQIKETRCSSSSKEEYDGFLSCPEEHWIAEEIGRGFQGSRNGVVDENASRERCDQKGNSKIEKCMNNPVKQYMVIIGAFHMKSTSYVMENFMRVHDSIKPPVWSRRFVAKFV